MMSWACQFGYHTRWRWGVMASLVVLCVYWPAHGHAARESQTPPTRQLASEGWARVTVVQGRLSVDLREADLQTVLAQIAQQAGFTLFTGPLGRQTVSVQFADVPLEQGIRRLLRLASLNHVMRSAPDAAGRVALKELRVFAGGDARGPLVTAMRPTDQAQQPEQPPATPTAPGQEGPQALENPFLAVVRRVQEQQQAQPQGEDEGAAPVMSFVESLRRAQAEKQAQPALSEQGQRAVTPGRRLHQ